MKKNLVIIINIIIMVAMLAFVIIYSNMEIVNAKQVQIAHFQNSTVNLEHVTENYLEGEQHVCDVWAHYINNENMTIEEATSFIRVSHVSKNASAHLIYADTLVGLSTRAKNGTVDDFNVSYERMNLFNDYSWISEEIGSASNNVTRSYTNPINGERSIAFCNFINLKESGTDNLKKAILLRVLPVSELENKWVFPNEEFENAELSVIDEFGDYIIQEYSYKNSNFFEFYKSYNNSNSTKMQELIEKLSTETGSISMRNSRGEECILAYTQFENAGSWTLLSIMPLKYLNINTENWLLIGVISSSLLLLFTLDLIFMLYFNKKLQLTAREAKSASKAKTDFLSTMSHDIRTPMNAIIGLTTIAEKNIDDKESVSENLRKINLASNHLLTLINDILDISKVESGKINLVPQTFSIVETVENLMNLSQPMIKEKNIEFSFHISHMEKEYLYADQLRLNQIYINILSNAIKYTEPNGSVNIDMKEEESEKEGCVKLTYTVSDTGIGMSKEFMNNMYQPFSRQTDSRVNSIQGTGLGLAITKQMVDLMEGNIECQSEEGVGTTFIITLDIPIAEHQRAEMKLGKMNVLIVDDDKILLETAVDTLQSLGLRAEQANSGLEALGMIKHREELGKCYDIIIIDLKMPDLDGIETIKRIRSEIKSSVPILLISAYSWSDVEEQAKEAGVNGFLSKPLFRSTLYNKISEVLGTEVDSFDSENDYSDLQGLNILVAEDNDINWEIISALLSMYGITSERAENGRIALEKIKKSKKNDYTLVFMDIQMPEMNGLDTTRAIRKLDNDWMSSIPIIAMTADAFAENIAECLDAGMNGHISKPIDIKLVIKEIRRIKEELRK